MPKRPMPSSAPFTGYPDSPHTNKQTQLLPVDRVCISAGVRANLCFGTDGCVARCVRVRVGGPLGLSKLAKLIMA